MARSASARRRSRGGNTCITLASARTEASAIPAAEPCAAVRSALTIATASSSSTTSGGSDPPGASWYPPPLPRTDCTG